MKLTEATITIFKGLAKFNNHLVIKAGNVLRSVNPLKTQFVEITVEEEFPVDAAFHDLAGFLKVISLFDEPMLQWKEKSVVISDGRSSQEYFYADTEDLIYPQKELKLPPEFEHTISFTNEVFAKTLKAAGMNKVEDIAFVGEAGAVSIRALNKENPKRVYEIKLQTPEGDPVTCESDFTVYLRQPIKGDKINILPLDYEMKISEHGIICLTAKIEDVSVMYALAIEADSTFSE